MPLGVTIGPFGRCHHSNNRASRLTGRGGARDQAGAHRAPRNREGGWTAWGGANLCSQSFGIYCNFFLVYIPVLTLRNIAPIASADPPCNPQEPNDRNRTEGPNGVENVPQHSCGKRASFSNPRIEYMYYNDAIPQDTRSCKLTVIILLLCPGGKHPAPAQRSRGVTRPLSPGGGGITES